MKHIIKQAKKFIRKTGTNPTFEKAKKLNTEVAKLLIKSPFGTFGTSIFTNCAKVNKKPTNKIKKTFIITFLFFSFNKSYKNIEQKNTAPKAQTAVILQAIHIKTLYKKVFLIESL